MFFKNTAYVLSGSGQSIIYFMSCALSSDRITHHITSASRALGQSSRSSVETKPHKAFASTLQPPTSARGPREANRRSEGHRRQARAACETIASCWQVENVLMDQSHYVSKHSIHTKTCENCQSQTKKYNLA